MSLASLDDLVTEAVSLLGHSYGRTVHGYFLSAGVHVSQRRISESLSRTAPVAMASRRRRTLLQFNPIPYNANSYGEKLHIDQNEKLNMFGVIHILAVDGFSRKIVGLITIPRKNPIDIYHALYRPLLLTEGIWEQIHVDHGTEFCLIGKVQQHLSQYRNRTRRLPFLQTTSRCNH